MDGMMKEYEDIGGKIEETVDLGELWRKVDEIVKWINEHEREGDGYQTGDDRTP